MKTWIVTRKSDGAEVYRYDAAQAIAFDGMGFDTHTHAPAPDTVVAAPVVAARLITKLAFRNRFTAAEKAALELAAADQPAAPMAQRAQAAGLRAYMEDLSVAQFIDLSRTDTRGGVQMLEAAGLIAAGRATAILDTEPTAVEVWRA